MATPTCGLLEGQSDEPRIHSPGQIDSPLGVMLWTKERPWTESRTGIHDAVVLTTLVAHTCWPLLVAAGGHVTPPYVLRTTQEVSR